MNTLREASVESAASYHQSTAKKSQRSEIDIDHLKMLNHTQLQDPILESFLEKAVELDQHCGSLSYRSVEPEPPKKIKKLSVNEAIK